MRLLTAVVAGPTVCTLGVLVAAAVIAAPTGTSAFASSTSAGSSCVVTGAAGGVRLSSEQMHNAQVIVAVAGARSLPERAAQIALMTAMQESTLRVLHHGDALGPDSLGLFQQRTSWGPASVRLDPAASTGLFLDRLIAVPGWESLAPEQAAHAVQQNANAGDYTKWIPFSVALQRSVAGGVPAEVQCSDGTLPAGAPPSDRARVALTAAASMLGKPYCWAGGDADGPTHGTGGPGCGPGVVGFDCSGLVLYAWARAGITLPHLAASDAGLGTRVPLAQAQQGDLVFLADAADGIHHVAMVWSINTATTTDAGQIIEAQDFNVPVHVRRWRGTGEPEVLPYSVRLAG